MDRREKRCVADLSLTSGAGLEPSSPSNSREDEELDDRACPGIYEELPVVGGGAASSCCLFQDHRELRIPKVPV